MRVIFELYYSKRIQNKLEDKDNKGFNKNRGWYMYEECSEIKPYKAITI